MGYNISLSHVHSAMINL